MSPPLFLLDDLAGQLDGGSVVLNGSEARHAVTVRRLRVGEPVDVADGLGLRVRGRVAATAADRLSVGIDEVVREPPPALRLVLVQALAKGERGEYAVELATEVGVDEIVPWAASRCVVQWTGPRGERSLERWRATAREAGKQSRRAWLPVVTQPASTAALLERCRAATALVLHEGASQPLAGVDLPDGGELLLVVGPEGGITDAELDRMVGAGALAVRLGPSVLRASTAGAVAAAVVSARTGRWG